VKSKTTVTACKLLFKHAASATYFAGSNMESAKKSKLPTDASVAGVRVSNRIDRVTTYTITNNDAARVVPNLYLDHTASSAHGGFAVTTVESCIKTTPSKSFARFSFCLGPTESITFTVNEEAETSKAITGVASVKQFLAAKDDAGAAALQGAGILEAEAISAMEKLVQTQSLLQVLETCKRAAQSASAGASKALSPANWRAKMRLPASWQPLLRSCERYQTAEARLADAKRALQAHRSHVTKIHESQKRIRENIKAMEKMPTSSLVQRYMDDLNKEEDDLIATREATEKLEGEEMVEIERELASVRATLEEQADGLRSATINQAAGSV